MFKRIREGETTYRDEQIVRLAIEKVRALMAICFLTGLMVGTVVTYFLFVL